jgi:hypothetical protein
MADSHTLRVFLAHSKEDKPLALEIYHLLRIDGFSPWIDKEDLLPGHDWELEIKRAVRESHAVVAFISSSGMHRRGYLHKEISLAIDVAEEQPKGTIYIIPICLDDCEIPDRLSHLHCLRARSHSVADIYVILQPSLLARASDLGLITADQRRSMPTLPGMSKGGPGGPLRPGQYLVRGQNPDSSIYFGLAQVTKSDDQYSLTWNIEDREIEGYGDVPSSTEEHVTLRGEYEVTFSGRSLTGVYKGIWGGRGTEELIPASPIAGTGRPLSRRNRALDDKGPES